SLDRDAGRAGNRGGPGWATACDEYVIVSAIMPSLIL
ncbi:MAG: hypothetical protein DMG71_08385, partial [Acidobacteria bacterium]